ncbi:hypothetical protein [Vibrio paucivorans]
MKYIFKSKDKKFSITNLVFCLVFFSLVAGMIGCNDESSSSLNTSQNNIKSVAVSLVEGALEGKSGIQVAKGLELKFKAIATYRNGEKEDITSSASWVSSSDTIANISSGVLTAKASGDVNIHASMSGVSSNVIEVVVTEASLELIQVRADYSTVPAGYEISLHAKGIFSDSSTVDMTSQVEWSSSDESYFTINESGVLTGLTAGEAFAQAQFSGVSSEQLPLRVSSATLTDLIMSPEGAIKLPNGMSTVLTVKGVFSDSQEMDLTEQVEWLSSKPTVLTVDKGQVETIGTGTSFVTAASGLVSAGKTFNVVNGKIDAIRIEDLTESIPAGSSAALTVIATVEGEDLDVTAQTDFTAVNSSIVSIVDNVVNGITEGKTIIIASFQGHMAQVEVQVTEATLEDISVHYEEAVFDTGLKHNIYVQGLYSDNVWRDISDKVSFFDDNNSLELTRDGNGFGVKTQAVNTKGPTTATFGLDDKTEEIMFEVRSSGGSTATQASVRLLISPTKVLVFPNGVSEYSDSYQAEFADVKLNTMCAWSINNSVTNITYPSTSFMNDISNRSDKPYTSSVVASDLYSALESAVGTVDISSSDEQSIEDYLDTLGSHSTSLNYLPFDWEDNNIDQSNVVLTFDGQNNDLFLEQEWSVFVPWNVHKLSSSGFRIYNDKMGYKLTAQYYDAAPNDLITILDIEDDAWSSDSSCDNAADETDWVYFEIESTQPEW